MEFIARELNDAKAYPCGKCSNCQNNPILSVGVRHDFILKAQTYLNDGISWVVDLDLEKFFDRRVNRDILMARIARHVKDKPVLRLIRRYLQGASWPKGS